MPLTVGGMTLPNRILMGSMHTGMEDSFRHYDELAAYFAERARGGVGLIVTGGIAPNIAGWIAPLAGQMTNRLHVRSHRKITRAVHAEGGHICMQILHAGRYGYHPFITSASAHQAPITPFKPRALSTRGVDKTIRDYVRSAELAREAGYDGVEIMASEGYLLNQFLVTRTNSRTDHYGGSVTNRQRIAVDIVQRMRETIGPDFIIIFRLSMLDLVEHGSSWDEVVQLARAVQAAGASIINTGIGWHEARVPTIVTRVPRAGFAGITHQLKSEVSLPLCTTNRINTPAVAEQLLADGGADMVSMARPLLADPDFVAKAATGRADEINTCIACNQACLDHVFQRKRATCLVNPRAGYETRLNFTATTQRKRIAVVGAGPAGLAAACRSAQRGHDVTLFERADAIGGQFNLAKRIPGKEEFHETLRYFQRQLELQDVGLKRSTEATAAGLQAAGFDAVIVATGVDPRIPIITGINHPSVASYVDIINGARVAGERVAVIGAGGIGFDVAELLTHPVSPATDAALFACEWGVDMTAAARAGLVEARPAAPPRDVFLLQRSDDKPGRTLGKTSGWAHRASLRHKNVTMLGGIHYERIDDDGLHIVHRGEPRVLGVDTVVICAGQEPRRTLAHELAQRGMSHHMIGGARLATELDAQRAIREASELAATI